MGIIGMYTWRGLRVCRMGVRLTMVEDTASTPPAMAQSLVRKWLTGERADDTSTCRSSSVKAGKEERVSMRWDLGVITLVLRGGGAYTEGREVVDEEHAWQRRPASQHHMPHSTARRRRGGTDVGPPRGPGVPRFRAADAVAAKSPTMPCSEHICC